jgi:hypothetical protein
LGELEKLQLSQGEIEEIKIIESLLQKALKDDEHLL